MHLLIPLCNLSFLINPQDRVLDLGRVNTRLVDADVDGQALAAGLVAEPQDKLAGRDRLDEGDCFGWRGGDVVGCFGEEEGLGLVSNHGMR